MFGSRNTKESYVTMRAARGIIAPKQFPRISCGASLGKPHVNDYDDGDDGNDDDNDEDGEA